MRSDYYLSLFFIPLFPVKRGQEFWACTRCGNLCSGPEAARAYTTSTYTKQDKPKNCPACGRRVEPDYTFCPQCGRRL